MDLRISSSSTRGLRLVPACWGFLTHPSPAWTALSGRPWRCFPVVGCCQAVTHSRGHAGVEGSEVCAIYTACFEHGKHGKHGKYGKHGKHGKYGKYGKLVRNSVQRCCAICKKTSVCFGFYSQNFMCLDALDHIEFRGPRGTACLGLRTA